MYSNLVKVNNPQIFFQHELDGIDWRSSQNKFFAFTDKNQKITDKQLFVPFDINDTRAWGADIFALKMAVEERYSQSVIDSCRKHHKQYGTKQYEWHLVCYPCVFNTRLSKIVYKSDDSYNEHIYIYDNLICICKNSIWIKVLDKNGNVLWDKGSGYGSSFNHLINTKLYVILATNHDYKTNTDQVIVFNKKESKIETIYTN